MCVCGGGVVVVRVVVELDVGVGMRGPNITIVPLRVSLYATISTSSSHVNFRLAVVIILLLSFRAANTHCC